MNKVVKKLVSFLFEEDTEVYAEDELEEVVFSKESEEEKKSVKKEKKEKFSIMKEEVEPVKKEAKEVKEIKAEKPSKRFQSIDLQDSKETKSHSFSKIDLAKRESTHKEYEFSPVISPMFGAKEEPVKPTSLAQPTILKARPKRKKGSTSAIISPIYGATDMEEEEEVIEQPIVNVEEDTSVVEEITMEGKEQLEEAESAFTKSIPLEELLQEEDYNKEDTMQISLFGEDTPVSQTENSADYTVKE